MYVSEINRYPLKSAAANTLEIGEVTFSGLSFDRHWMVVTESGRFISQREKGAQKLSLVNALLNESGLELSAPNCTPIVIPLENPESKEMKVELHGNFYKGIDAGEDAARWISAYLPPWRGESFRLVYFPADFHRATIDEYTQHESARTEFADGYAILITSESSLADLNQRLEAHEVDPVLMNVFRPNIVIAGDIPWNEDTLREIKVGDAILEVVKPCGRCPITGVTQELGKFSRKPLEPRETLKEFHAGKHLLDKFPHLDPTLLDAPMFGQNAVVLKGGSIKKNDPIEVLSRR